MSEQERPYIWQMLREGIETLGGRASNGELRDWVLEKYPGTNPNSISADITAKTVNHPSRIHFPSNQRARIADDERLDFLYRPERGRLELYDPVRHGQYQIVENEDGSFAVSLVEDHETEDVEDYTFAAEAHLRDFLAGHLDVIEDGLELFIDDQGQSGVEYATPIGRIDILAKDRDGHFLVIELKVRKGPDRAAGQLMRYRSWVARHLVGRRERVRSCLVAARISDKLIYALADIPDVMLKEYVLEVRLTDVDWPELGDGTS